VRELYITCGKIKINMAKFIKGHIMSKETREKLRLANLGKKQSPETIEKRVKASTGQKRTGELKELFRQQKLGSNNPMFGKKPSDAHRLKLSIAAKKYWGSRVDVDRQKRYERIRHSVEYKLWRESVFKRDNYTCVECGDKKGGNLEADHIKPFAAYPELRFDITNGRTLCVSCHRKTPTWGIYAIKNRQL
jgi:5-methylcytosine-specific restriction endonuclease McrA